MDLREELHRGARVHLVGIGGVSMAPLAEVLWGAGVSVTGSDLRGGESIDRLRELGIPVAIGHRPENVDGAECVIRTAAAHDDNPEIAEARRRGIPVFERAQAWGAIMQDYRNALCIAGTHGKTTTTSMCTHIALAAQADPTVMIGGTLPLLGAGYRVGRGEDIILESCEYCNSFLSFFPTVAVILNIDRDHLDFFKDLADIQRSFRRFAELTPPDGWVIANAEDANTVQAMAGIRRRVLTFGREQGDVHGENLVWAGGFPEFDAVYEGRVYAHITLGAPGLHNVKNALAATAAAIALGWPGRAVEEGLRGFHGAGRRFERLGEYRGAAIYDDYAHHPGEIRALLETAKTLGYRRVVCAFQPHTYSRTKKLFGEFAQVLTLADAVFLTDIYAARERDTLGVSSAQLAAAVPGARYCPGLEALQKALAREARPGDLILLVGAGDIFTVGRALAAAGEDNFRKCQEEILNF